jgi:hypothetical protein
MEHVLHQTAVIVTMAFMDQSAKPGNALAPL